MSSSWFSYTERVVCLQLGYRGGSKSCTYKASNRSETRMQWLDDVSCRYYETNILSCRKSKWNPKMIATSNLLGVYCLGKISLMPGTFLEFKFSLLLNITAIRNIIYKKVSMLSLVSWD